MCCLSHPLLFPHQAGKGPQLFPTPPTDILLRPFYPFFALKVPQVAKLQNYDPLDVQACSQGHVPVRAIRQFKIGALDEIISLPTPPPLLLDEEEEEAEAEAVARVEGDMAVEDLEEAEPSAGMQAEADEEAALRRANLRPPAALFQPIQYPPLHIFVSAAFFFSVFKFYSS